MCRPYTGGGWGGTGICCAPRVCGGASICPRGAWVAALVYGSITDLINHAFQHLVFCTHPDTWTTALNAACWDIPALVNSWSFPDSQYDSILNPRMGRG